MPFSRRWDYLRRRGSPEQGRRTSTIYRLDIVASGKDSVAALQYVAGSTRQEVERAFAHIFRIAQSAGFTRTDIVYVDFAFIDLADVREVNDLFANLFPEGQQPARTIYKAANLPFGGRIKVQAIAARG